MVDILDKTGEFKYSDVVEHVVSHMTEAEVSVMIVCDKEIQELNLQYRGMDKPTDVLSFPMEDEEYLGDIVISLPRARAQAEEYGHSIEREIAFLTAHSMLHLMGYDHEDEMFAKQEEILNELGYKRTDEGV